VTERELLEKVLVELRKKGYAVRREFSIYLPLERAVKDAEDDADVVGRVFNRISVDAVAENDAEILIIEAKKELSRALIGDVITAKLLYEKTQKPSKKVRAVAVFGSPPKPILLNVCNALGIETRRVSQDQRRSNI